MPQDPLAAQLARFNFGQKSFHSSGKSSNGKKGSGSGSNAAATAAAAGTKSARPATVAAQQQHQKQQHLLGSDPRLTDVEALPSAQGVVVLAQALCLLRVTHRSLECETLRAVSALDTTSMLPANAVIMQLSGLKADALPAAAPALLLSLRTEDEGLSTLHFAAALASFGPDLPLLSDGCVTAMRSSPPDLAQLPLCPPDVTVNPYWRPSLLLDSSSSTSSSKGRSKLSVFAEAHYLWQQQRQAAADPWLLMSPSSSTCEAVRAAQQQEQVDYHSSSSNPAVAAPTRTLLGNCLGYDPATYTAGYWLPQPALFNVTCPCSSPAVTAAATRSAFRAAAPDAALLPVTAPLLLADPPHACRRLRNGPLLAGSIAVVRRGGCSFVDKAVAAADAGAYGVVVLDNEAPGQLLTMSDDGSGRAPDVPTIMLEARDSATLLFWLERRPLLGSLVGHSLPPAAGKGVLLSAADAAEEQRELLAAAQQRRQQQEKKAAAAADGKHGQDMAAAGEQQQQRQQQGRHPLEDVVQTRIDMFVPGRSQAWLQQHVIKAGIDGSTAYQALARDPRVLGVLKGAYERNKAHNGAAGGGVRTLAAARQQHPPGQLVAQQRAATGSSGGSMTPPSAEGGAGRDNQPVGHSGG